MTRSSIHRLLAAFSLGVVVAAALVVTAPPAAQAHDQVVSTTPASQEHRDGAPHEVSMVFTDDILEIGATILVVDDAGTNWVDGDLRVDGAEAIQALKAEMPDGRYQVRWRVVSSDGHPISGTFDFAVGEVGAPVAAPTAKAAPPAQTAPSANPGSLEAATDSAANRNDSVGVPFVLIGIGGALVGVAVFLLVLVLRPRSRATDTTRD